MHSWKGACSHVNVLFPFPIPIPFISLAVNEHDYFPTIIKSAENYVLHAVTSSISSI